MPISNYSKGIIRSSSEEFWHRFTGDEDFYVDLINAIGEVANEYNMKRKISQVVSELAKDIKEKYPDLAI